MNKIERMQAVLAGKAPDYTPAGFWFHYPASLTAEEAADAHVQLYHQLDNDIIKVMDDSFGHMITEGIHIEKPSDWRNIKLPGRDCSQYRKMESIIRLIAEKTNHAVMIFPTMWSPFKIASFTYCFAGSDDATFMKHCAEDPESVLAGVQTIADALTDWVRGYIEAGASGIYYSGQFSEPQRFDAATWEKLVKPSDLQILTKSKPAAAATSCTSAAKRSTVSVPAPKDMRVIPAICSTGTPTGPISHWKKAKSCLTRRSSAVWTITAC